MITFPTIEKIVAVLSRVQSSLDAGEEPCDVRLQVYEDGEWAIRIGDPSYDQDHHGFWGASSLGTDDTPETIAEMAQSLLAQSQDDHAMQVEHWETRHERE